MASVLKVDKLDPQSGTDLEIGTSGDTITIPSGATIVNSGTATGFGGGKVLQVQSTAGTHITTTTSTSYADNITVSITPSATSSKILIIHAPPSNVHLDNTTNMFHASLFRDSTNLTTSGHNSSWGVYRIRSGEEMSGVAIHHLDSPSSTSSITYKIRVKVDNASLEGVYGHHTTQPCQSSLTAMEIGA